MLRIKLWAMAGLTLVVGCAGADGKESTVEHQYTVDVSQYSAPNEPASLFIPNENLALPLEAKDLTLSEAEPGSLQQLYTRSFCSAGQLPTELPGWDTAEFLEVVPVHLTRVSITIEFDGNDLIRKPTFAVRDSQGRWTGCLEPSQVAHNATTLTASVNLDHPDAVLVGIFPDTYTRVRSLSYTTLD